jgi:chemotaxis protein histidine kinase CheA
VSAETPTLEELAAELESVADKLRSEAVDSDEAADLVDRCAELAQRIGAEIDARSRSAAEAEGQERLL